VKIADRNAEKQPPDRTEHRIAQITMKERHGAWLDFPLESIAHDQLRATAQPLNEAVESGEIVTAVRVSDDDE
jgi:hypothetical protein